MATEMHAGEDRPVDEEFRQGSWRLLPVPRRQSSGSIARGTCIRLRHATRRAGRQASAGCRGSRGRPLAGRQHDAFAVHLRAQLHGRDTPPCCRRRPRRRSACSGRCRWRFPAQASASSSVPLPMRTDTNMPGIRLPSLVGEAGAGADRARAGIDPVVEAFDRAADRRGRCRRGWRARPELSAACSCVWP